MMYACCRDLFAAAREASRDALTIEAQLRALEESSQVYGSATFQPRVRGTSDPDRLGRIVSSNVDREAQLKSRLDDDYRLIDAACEVLYGTDQTSDGIASLFRPWVADAIWHHYLGMKTWEEVSGIVCYSSRYIQEQVRVAFELADANGDMWTRRGRGAAT